MIGAGRYERSRTARERNGHRPRLLTTPAGDIELAIPKLPRQILPEPARAAATHRSRLSTRWSWRPTSTESHLKVDDLVKALGAASGISKSEVSRICAGLDKELAEFRSRPLGHVAFPYDFADATYVKGHVRGRVVSRAVVIATEATAHGDRGARHRGG